MIELLVVIAIMAVIAGIAFPSYVYVQKQGKLKATRALVHAVTAAIADYDATTAMVETGGRRVMRRIWDLNEDGLLDEDPTAAGAAGSLKSVAPAWYRGFVYMSGISVNQRAIDANGAIVDPWRRQLRIRFAALAFQGSSVGISSDGPDGVSAPDDVSGDDICSWR